VISPIRVLVRDVPHLVRDVLEHVIVAQPDMTLLRDRPGPSGSELAVSDPDVVILGARRPRDSEGVTAVLWKWPATQVLQITVDGHEAAVYRLEIKGTEFGELSPIELISVIRAAAERRKAERER
jgi:hypothetical protein